MLDFPGEAVSDRLKYARHGQRPGLAGQRPSLQWTGETMTIRKFLLWFAAGLLLFAIGRRFSATANDLIVYHTAARNLLEGRTDLYSDSFALKPPMIYGYPPLFLLFVSPIGWLNFETAYGLWLPLWPFHSRLSLDLPSQCGGRGIESVMRAWESSSVLPI
jgi:hypothetical protein